MEPNRRSPIQKTSLNDSIEKNTDSKPQVKKNIEIIDISDFAVEASEHESEDSSASKPNSKRRCTQSNRSPKSPGPGQRSPTTPLTKKNLKSYNKAYPPKFMDHVLEEDEASIVRTAIWVENSNQRRNEGSHRYAADPMTEGIDIGKGEKVYGNDKVEE